MGTKRDLRTLPELEGWLTFPEIAAFMGISRQRVHQLAESGIITTAHRRGRTYLAREAEIRVLRDRKQAPAPRSYAVVPAHPSPDGQAISVIGGVAVTEHQLRQAVEVLEQMAAGRGSFKQALAKHGNPLAKSDYLVTARAYRAAHPEVRGLGTKQVLLAAYRAQLEQVPVAV